MSYYLEGAKYDPAQTIHMNAYRAHGAELDSLYLSYELNFDSTFNIDGIEATGKLPGLAGTREGGGDQVRSTGTNGWSARLGWEQVEGGGANKDSIAIYGYIYHKNQIYDWGDCTPCIGQGAQPFQGGR